MEETIKRINELYHLSQKRPLTEEELKEQGLLRAEYLSAIRASVKGQLSNVQIVEKNGDIHPLESLKERKNNVRKQCLEIRKNISAERFAEAGENLKNEILKLVEKDNIKYVSVYASKDGEIPTDPLFEALIEKGITVCYPIVQGNSLIFQSVKSLDELKVGTFGVREPESRLQEMKTGAKIPGSGIVFTTDIGKELILLPGLSFDREGHRIGYGKGYYDLFLEGIESTGIHTVGACMKECMAENLKDVPDGKLPCEKHDIKADEVIIV